MIKVITFCLKDSDREPFSEWLDELDIKTQSIIYTRLDRIIVGNFGDCKSLGDGIWELRITYGPGYRIYFGKKGQQLVVLLAGGDKGSQSRDIAKARRYWLTYKESLDD